LSSSIVGFKVDRRHSAGLGVLSHVRSNHMYKDIIRFLDDNSSAIHCSSGWDFNANTDSEKPFF